MLLKLTHEAKTQAWMYISYLFEAVYILHDLTLEKKGLECGLKLIRVHMWYGTWKPLILRYKVFLFFQTQSMITEQLIVQLKMNGIFNKSTASL